MELINALLPKLKMNLILQHGEDDEFLRGVILAALSYAEIYQRKPTGAYTMEPVAGDTMKPTTEQAVIMLASHLYESRDGSTGGFFADSPSAARQSLETVDRMLALDKEYVVY